MKSASMKNYLGQGGELPSAVLVQADEAPVADGDSPREREPLLARPRLELRLKDALPSLAVYGDLKTEVLHVAVRPVLPLPD